MLEILKISLCFYLTILALTSCSSRPRTVWTDPVMRVMVDPDGISARNYVRIVNALKASGKWFVVDRRDGLRAILKEQRMLHRTMADRFKDEEKYSIWGRLYGVGGVVIANAQCHKSGFWQSTTTCVQNLAIVSANSGEVVATAEGENDDGDMSYGGDIRVASDWTDTVGKLNDAFPKNFEKEKYSPEMHAFRAEAKEEAIRQKENIGKDKATEKRDAVYIPDNKVDYDSLPH